MDVVLGAHEHVALGLQARDALIDLARQEPLPVVSAPKVSAPEGRALCDGDAPLAAITIGCSLDRLALEQKRAFHRLDRTHHIPWLVALGLGLVQYVPKILALLQELFHEFVERGLEQLLLLLNEQVNR